MRSLGDARKAWDELRRFHSIDQLRQAARHEEPGSLSSNGLRSAAWKGLLVFESVDTDAWPKALSSSRSAYDALREHFLSSDGLADVDDEADSALRSDIQQDVERCMPENYYFRTPETQRMLFDILFVYCKMNPDIGYRQGMHELAAPVLFVVERDAVDVGQSSKAMGEDAVVRTVFDADHIEHDAFALFSHIMQSAKVFYEQGTHSGAHQNPIVVRSERIFNELLPLVDPELAQHLQRIEIMPQIFLLRWIRLLFGREFAFDHVLAMWDVVFAEDPSLELANHIALLMLLRLRWKLLATDYNTGLSLLLHSSVVERDFAPRTFVLDAVYLRSHMDFDSSSYLILKYTGRALQPVDRPHTPPALPRNVTAFSGSKWSPPTLHSSDSPRRETTRNIETILQSTAINIYNRGEKLGIGRAVRSAVDEVHRKALEIRNGSLSPPDTSDVRPSHEARLEALEQRNSRLATLLSGAVSDLWDYQKVVTESEHQVGDVRSSALIERLSIAIAKVQFVQVYLSDANLPLDIENTESNRTEVSNDNTADVSNSNTDDRIHRTTWHADAHGDVDQASAISSEEVLPPKAQQEVRPTIAESRYSWMLGQAGEQSSPPPSVSATPKRNSSEPVALFGAGPQESLGSVTKRKARPRKAAAETTAADGIF